MLSVAFFAVVLLAAPLTLVVGALGRPAAASLLGGLAALGAMVLLCLLWAADAGVLVDVAWLPTLHSRLTLELDPLAAPMAVLVAGLGALVVAYAAAYMPHHLRRRGAPPARLAYFQALLLGFMAAMLVLVLAQDLLVLFVVLDLTAVSSFLLIEFDRDNRQARRNARLALVLTAGTSLLFLAGCLLLWQLSGSVNLADLRAASRGGPWYDVAVYALVLGVLAKSAQVPLHFWLPRAMVAPTPVSAYLHSAAMVAAGAFVLLRLRFLLEDATGALTVVTWVGIASIALGSLRALVAQRLKELLAYSTIAQYGYVLVLIGLGGEHGLVGALVYLLAHGVAKAALFMTAGAVTRATGEDRLAHLGGLWRHEPLLALGSATAAATLAGLPLTVGYFKDDLLFAAARAHGPIAALAAALAAAATLGYTLRFWFGAFGGRAGPRPSGASGALAWPVLLLGGVGLVGGWSYPWLARVGTQAAAAVAGQKVTPPKLGYQLSVELLLAVLAWGLGLALYLSRRRWKPRVRAALAGRAGRVPQAWPLRLRHGLAWLSNRLHEVEVRDLRDRVGWVLIPTAVLIFLALFSPQFRYEVELGAVEWRDLPLALGLLVAAGAALATLRPASHVGLILQLSFVGFGLALVFAHSAAVEVALVAVLTETGFTLIFLATLSRIPPQTLARGAARAPRRRDPWLALCSGAAAAGVAWGALSEAPLGEVARAYVELADAAHAQDVVTAILSDFRGLDTAAEVTVLALAALGALAVRWERRP